MIRSLPQDIRPATPLLVIERGETDNASSRVLSKGVAASSLAVSFCVIPAASIRTLPLPPRSVPLLVNFGGKIGS
ncbi:TPA: hypothetical protein ACSRD7_001576 [Yersinia enterocolitica]|nr:hypothetical protein [Yersinia enterocolitica]HEN3308903.1 hypothetical protein [Yersinia enterocolitica]